MSQHRKTRSAQKTRLNGVVVAIRIDPAQVLSTVRSLATMPDPLPRVQTYPQVKHIQQYVRAQRQGTSVPVG